MPKTKHPHQNRTEVLAIRVKGELKDWLTQRGYKNRRSMSAEALVLIDNARASELAPKKKSR